MFFKDSFFPFFRALILAFCCTAIIAFPSFPATAAKSGAPAETEKAARKKNDKDDEPALLQADQLSYDQNTDTITASGNVEISRGGQILKADRITFNQKINVIKARGHIAILQPGGEVMFADEAEVTGDLKQGFVDQVRVLFPDNSRMAARDARRYEGRYLVAHLGVYSSCDLCREKPDKPPLWQIKAARVTHDNQAHDVIYRDLTLEMGGVPVMYSPYFSHPDPTVKRRQGFLTPSGGYTQYLGVFARVPYYIDIAPNSDLVLTPVFSEKDRAQLGSEWRHRFSRGEMRWSGSFTHTDLVDEYGTDLGKKWRGHVFGDTLFNINNEWRAGNRVAITSDKSYLQRYNITSEDMLTNRGYAEWFRGRNYAVSNLYMFQNLRPGSQRTEPLVLPDMQFSALGEPGKTLGGRWFLDGGLLVTSRDQNVNAEKQGPNTRRMSFGAGWERQMVSSTGLLGEFSGIARIDGYWADNVADPTFPAGSGFSGVFDIRQFAQAETKVRYPLGRRGDSYQQIIEPIGMLTVAPKLSERRRLPNEDSLDVEFDETNLFASNRFTGIDRLEGGVRSAYGIRHSLIGDNGARIELVGGQVFRFEKDENFPEGSGLRDQFSDYVGRVEFSPAPWLDASYGFRLDRKEMIFQRQEAQLSAGAPVFRPFVNYMMANQTEATTGISTHIEEGVIGFNSSFAKYYSLFASHRQAFLPQPGPRNTTAGIYYRDECFQLGVTGQRTISDREDIRKGTSVIFHFYLKNIGGIHTDSISSGNFLPSSQTK